MGEESTFGGFSDPDLGYDERGGRWVRKSGGGENTVVFLQNLFAKITGRLVKLMILLKIIIKTVPSIFQFENLFKNAQFKKPNLQIF